MEYGSLTLIRQLHQAIEDRNIAEVRAMLLRNPGAARHLINALDDQDGKTGIHLAAYSGQLQLARLLLDAGANVNGRNIGEETPLHEAVRCESGAMVELLLSRGGDPTLEDYRGMSPFEFCFQNSYSAEVLGTESPAACLVRHGQQVDLVQAISLGLVQQVDELLDAPGNPLEGVRPEAARRVATSYISYLLLLCDQTCEHLAEVEGHAQYRPSVVRSLLEKKWNVLERLARLKPEQTISWGLIMQTTTHADWGVLSACASLGFRAELTEGSSIYEPKCRDAASRSRELAELMRRLGFPI